MSDDNLHEDECGATATEYALLIAFIAMTLVLGVTAFGNGLDQAFENLAVWVDDRAAEST